MIWLASYPRSGNTFFRNVLLEVYGLESGDYHLGHHKEMDPDFESYPFVKTHLLPSQLPPDIQSTKSVYLIRDGRDAAVSLAHHRIDIKETGNSFNRNLIEIILGIGNSFKGGWSGHVSHWTKHADVIIRFEDLIKDPISEVEKLRSIMDLPEPAKEKLPTFIGLKKGIPEYGSGQDLESSEHKQKEHATKFFRRGKVGSYKDEMPKMFQWIFWILHRKQMKKYGYYRNGR